MIAWGGNDDSELGAVTTEICRNGGACSEVPVEVCTTNDSPCTTPLTGIAQIAAGRRFSTALTLDGKVLTWGRNELGNLGNSAQSAVSIATGSFHVHALRDDGLLFSWGNNNLGSLGNNDDTPLALVPVVVGGF